jgi:hypothetical protein
VRAAAGRPAREAAVSASSSRTPVRGRDCRMPAMTRETWR